MKKLIYTRSPINLRNIISLCTDFHDNKLRIFCRKFLRDALEIAASVGEVSEEEAADEEDVVGLL